MVSCVVTFSVPANAHVDKIIEVALFLFIALLICSLLCRREEHVLCLLIERKQGLVVLKYTMTLSKQEINLVARHIKDVKALVLIEHLVGL